MPLWDQPRGLWRDKDKVAAEQLKEKNQPPCDGDTYVEFYLIHTPQTVLISLDVVEFSLKKKKIL